MKMIFILAFVSNVILAFVSLVVCPDRVAIHFGTEGMPDSWAPRYVATLIMLATHVMLFLLFYGAGRLVTMFPPRWISMPNRDYWLAEERKQLAQSKITSLMMEFGTVMYLFLFIVGLLALDANLRTPVRFRSDFMWPSLGLFFLYTAYWVVKFYREFRVPEADRDADPGENGHT